MAHDESGEALGRVRIVYGSGGDEGSEVELPFKVLIMGDFSGLEDGIPLGEREPIPVTADNLDGVMRALGPGVEISVRDALRGEEGSRVPVSLRFESLEDFAPRRLALRVAPLREAADLRRRLLEARRALSENPALASELRGLMAKEGAREGLLGTLGKGRGPAQG
jgi:type VI secretion system protein ImpB